MQRKASRPFWMLPGILFENAGIKKKFKKGGYFLWERLNVGCCFIWGSLENENREIVYFVSNFYRDNHFIELWIGDDIWDFNNCNFNWLFNVFGVGKMKIKENIYVIYCRKCRNKQQIIIRTSKIYGETRKCFYCGKTITINKDNLLGRAGW